MSEPSSSQRLRAAVASQRKKNDELATSLGLNPAEERVKSVERDALRLVRLLARTPNAKILVAQLTEASHELLDADVALTRSKQVKK